MAFELRSLAFRNHQPIPSRHAKDHENLSPALEWFNPPVGTKEFAILMEDPDAPGARPFVHWLLYGIDSQVSSIPEGIHVAGKYGPVVGFEGRNSFEELGYSGPLPPVGFPPHHYQFRLLALDEKLNWEAGIQRGEFFKAVNSHILDEADLTGIYQRTGTRAA